MSDLSVQSALSDRVHSSGRSVQNVGSLERWASVLGGGALLLRGIDKGSLLSTGIGASLLYRGLSGHCYLYGALGMSTHRSESSSVPAQAGFKYENSVTIHKPAQELYDYWRNFQNLPRIMNHLEDVQTLPNGRSCWSACGPMGLKVSWEAEIINEEPGRLIAWRSLDGSDVDTAGSVHFDERGDGETVLTVSLKYNPPAGKLGATIAWLMGSGVEQQIDEDLRRFKQMMEAGEVATAQR